MVEFIIFILAVFVAFFIPGNLLLLPLKRTNFENIVLGTVLGIVLWSIQGYIFGFVGIRWMSYGYLTVVLILWIYYYRKIFFKSLNFKIPQKIDYLSIFIIILGTFLNLSAVWYLGIKQSDGLFFCCRGVPDAIYHLSLTSQLINNFPPYEPGMSGVLLKNYHFLSNLVVADLSRVFGLDFVKVQFQFMSILLALLLGASAFILANILKLRITF